MRRASDAAFDDADLNAFVDGRIDPARAAGLAESLASDPEAQARIDGWKRQNESLRTMFASVLFEPVPARLIAGPMPARASGAEVAAAPEAGQPWRVSAGVLVTTSIGMALVGMALGALAGLNLGDAGLAHPAPAALLDAPARGGTASRPLSQVAVEAHRTYVGDPLRPVEMTDAPRLTRWMQRRVGSAARIPDLSRQGWKLVGGRIVPGPRGPAAFLIYADGSDRLSLTLSRSAGTRSESVVSHDGPDPVASASWADDAYAYVLVSGRGAPWLARTAGPLEEEIRAQAADADPLP